MNESNKSEIVVPAIICILQLILFVFKSTNIINWNWGWVLAPLWIPFVLFMVCSFILFIYLIVSDIKERIFVKHG